MEHLWVYFYGIYQSQISHHGHLPYFTVHHFGTELCTRLFQVDAWWDIGNVHYGIWGLIYYLSVWLTHWGLKKRLQMIFCKISVNQPVQKPVIITMTSYSDVSNYQPHNCFLNRLFRRRSKKISKLRVTGLWGGNSPVTGDSPAQRASNTENVSIWWSHHVRNTLAYRMKSLDQELTFGRVLCAFERTL